MKVGEFISVLDRTEKDVDVYGGSWAIAYVGTQDVVLTDEGRAKFAPVMEIEVEWSNDGSTASVKAATDELDGLAKEFFYAAAGWVPDSLYQKWFKEV